MNSRSLRFRWTILVAVLTCVAGANAANKPVTDESGFHRRPNLVSVDQPGIHPPQFCKGKPPPSPELEVIKLTARLEKEGARCVAGDFDGNGSLDFILYDAPDAATGIYKTGYSVQFDGPQITRVKTISNPPTQLWPAGSPGPCARDTAHPDGLMQGGNGGLARTLLLNLANGRWTEDTCGGKAEVEVEAEE